MILVTNPGTSLPPGAVDRYRLELTAQRIEVDGRLVPSAELGFDEVDRLVREAKVHPKVVGSSSGEFLDAFRALGAKHPGEDIVVILSSRRIIGSVLSAEWARDALAADKDFRGGRIHVVDSKATDLATGLLVLLAGEAVRAGHATDEVVHMLARAAEAVRVVFYVDTLDNLVKSGRAGFVKQFVADFLKVRPLLRLRDGEVKSATRVGRSDDRVEKLVELLAGELDGKGPVWAGVAHGGVPELAQKLGRALEQRFDVRHLVVRPFMPSIYLNLGRGAVSAVALPLGAVGWVPPKPAV